MNTVFSTPCVTCRIGNAELLGELRGWSVAHMAQVGGVSVKYKWKSSLQHIPSAVRPIHVHDHSRVDIVIAVEQRRNATTQIPLRLKGDGSTRERCDTTATPQQQGTEVEERVGGEGGRGRGRGAHCK
jgi:hypothetical protein